MSVALGKAWSYSVNVRLAISYQGDQRKSFNKQSIPRLIQADEMHLIGKQLRP